MKAFFSAVALFPLAMAALPAGFEDEIYCPPGMCLRDKLQHGPRQTGPRAHFVECFGPASLLTHRPRVWGSALDIELKESILRDQWHTRRCDSKPDIDLMSRFELLDSRLALIVGRLSGLTFI
jgi:hypothetical protein